MESAVIDLKAELQRRKATLTAERLAGKQNEIKAKLYKIKQIQGVSSVKLKDVKEDNKKEEDDMLEKSKAMLQKKAALYDQIQNGSSVLENDELNEKFLINFQKKIEDSVSQADKNEDEEWIEYVDPLGRTRRCLKTDLEYMKERDREMMPEKPKPDLVELERAKIHEKWDKIEEEAKEKRDIHYQDILFDEAREHGVGFMPFSRNEAERASQREMLNNLRVESKKAEISSKAARKEADRRMADRLTKVRQRKRLKLGLPIKDLYEEKLPTPPSSDDETPQEPLLEHVNSAAPIKPKSVREWDVGKSTDVMDQRQWDVGKSTDVMDQRQWVESRRKLREEQFAPPQSYARK